VEESKKRFTYRLNEILIEKLSFFEDKSQFFVKSYIKSEEFRSLLSPYGRRAASVTLLHSDVYNR